MDASTEANTVLHSGSVSNWIVKLKQGDADAAEQLWRRYYRRLVTLARKKLQDAPRRAADEDDVVQSVFKSFCLRARQGLFPDLRDRHNLWPLLVLIVSRKASNQRRHDARLKRRRKRVADSADDARNAQGAEFRSAVDRDPSPEDAAIFFDELQKFLNSLSDPSQKLIFLWKLEQRTNSEIASKLDCSVSAVDRKLRLIRNRLRRLV
ncbi:MAG TPA: sigma-70 family RNA polymerase sigma factor [Lacipirellulaceae bacterium]|jgi:RNA polymerase sigma factor (sigma-70 family)|nr:sigma-70 family RNA polymerase sigma factor [Lacipirellulaceae bacterium]